MSGSLNSNAMSLRTVGLRRKRVNALVTWPLDRGASPIYGCESSRQLASPSLEIASRWVGPSLKEYDSAWSAEPTESGDPQRRASGGDGRKHTRGGAADAVVRSPDRPRTARF